MVRAFSEFDDSLRGNKNWEAWEENGNYGYAVEYEGKRYPPKMILSLAAGVPVGSFSGGTAGANAALAKHGFSIIPLGASVEPKPAEQQVWWVNQGRSYEKERAGGFIWAPKRDKRGGERATYRRLQEVRTGDVIIHYAEAAIRAVSRVLEPATDAPNPHEKNWDTDGWRVSVEYFDLGSRQVPGQAVSSSLGGLDVEDGPFQTNRAIKVGYLWRFTPEGLARVKQLVGDPWPPWANVEAMDSASPFTIAAGFERLVAAVNATSFVFEPWQVAAYVTAVRTKPFVILAGVSGTGKSQLPVLVAKATGGVVTTIPVRPDWTDSSDVLGYADLQGTFRPGPVLDFARRAAEDPRRYYVCVVDEMNLARVEHYFAEVLSRVESRDAVAGGGYASLPLLGEHLQGAGHDWTKVPLPANLAIVGTVNMDESAHGFSRKVLDRAFTLELSDVDLSRWPSAVSASDAAAWPAAAWFPRAIRLGELNELASAQRQAVARVVDVLMEANAILARAQLQIGYRTRDEIALFVLAAQDIANGFVERDGSAVDAFDLALQMKLLPRVAGGSGPVRHVLLGLLGFATSGHALDKDQEADAVINAWSNDGRPGRLTSARFPRTAARLCLMWERLRTEGFTSFWL